MRRPDRAGGRVPVANRWNGTRTRGPPPVQRVAPGAAPFGLWIVRRAGLRSEEHTSELQSQSNLVCRLLLEKKKKNSAQYHTPIATAYLPHLHLTFSRV